MTNWPGVGLVSSKLESLEGNESRLVDKVGLGSVVDRLEAEVCSGVLGDWEPTVGKVFLQFSSGYQSFGWLGHVAAVWSLSNWQCSTSGISSLGASESFGVPGALNINSGLGLKFSFAGSGFRLGDAEESLGSNLISDHWE